MDSKRRWKLQTSDQPLAVRRSGRRNACGLFAAQLLGLGLSGYLGQKDGVARVQVWLADPESAV